VDAEFIRELFSDFGPVQVRRLFGGAGLFADGLMFGLVMGGQIYLKANAASIPLFEAEGCGPFEYGTSKGMRVLTSHWRLPDRLYDDTAELAQWAKRALVIARQKAAARVRSKPTSKPVAKPGKAKTGKAKTGKKRKTHRRGKA
jgi:DNA transformation protein